MQYAIIEVKKIYTESDGWILLVKANQAQSSMNDIPLKEGEETESFLFPFSDEKETEYLQLSEQSRNQHILWNPFDTDEFVEDTIETSDGSRIDVYRSVDTIPELTMDPDWEDEDDMEENFEYSEDLFDVDPLDHDDIDETSAISDNDMHTTDVHTDNSSVDATYSTKRFSEKDIKEMTVHEKYEERSKCAKAKNLYALLDFYTYDFKNGCAAMNEYVIPALAYLYGRAKDIDTLNSLLKEYAFCLWELSSISKKVTTNLVGIGFSFPYLSTEQIDYLEHLYNMPKYCETMDEILFDKERLSRKITGITKEDLKKTNDHFSEKLLRQTFNSFILNLKAQNERDDEYTEYYVYVRRNNNIVKKEYVQVGSGEYVLNGTLDNKSLIEFIEPKYGTDCSNFFLHRILQKKPWYDDISDLCRSEHEWIDWHDILDIAKEYFTNYDILDGFKMDIALIYLQKLNKKK